MSELPALHHILDRYDALLVDLDGTVFRGDAVIPGAHEGLRGRSVIYVTNNASRSPMEVAAHVTSLGFSASAEDVLTSAQAACSLAKGLLTAQSVVDAPTAYIVGTDSFRDLAREEGFTVVNSADDHPDLVLQGHSPENNWAMLSEAALAVQAGAVYVASNLDTTLPNERGFLVGNGSMVAAVVSATGVVPQSAGKPEPMMFQVASRRLGASRPLVIGDRLDTDIAGGIAAGMDTLCVLTGVSTHREILHTEHRPTWIAANLSDHLGGWSAHQDSGHIVVSSGDTGHHGDVPTSMDVEVMAAEALAVAAPLVWQAEDENEDVTVTAAEGDTFAAMALEGWR